MKNKKLIFPIIALIVIAGAGGIITLKKRSAQRVSQIEAAQETQGEATTEVGNLPQANDPASSTQSVGRYTEYSAEKQTENGYNQTVLFFHAAWCPECRSFKKAITGGMIPTGTQILEVNYDTASNLKKQHGVTLQSTFVKVDSNGKQLSKWVGYGKDKTLQTVLSNL